MPARRVAAAMIAAIAITLAGCTNSDDAGPTTTPLTMPSSSSEEASSSAAPTSSPEPTSSPVTTSESPISSSSEPTTSAATSKAKTTKTTPKPSITQPPLPPAVERYPVAIPAAVKGDYRQAAAAGVKVYRLMLDTIDKSRQDPKSKDWTKEFAKSMANPALDEWVRGTYEPMAEEGIRVVGYSKAKAVVENATLDTVDIRACFEPTGGYAVDKDGKPIEESMGTEKYAWVIQVFKLDSGWRVKTLILQTADKKLIKC